MSFVRSGGFLAAPGLLAALGLLALSPFGYAGDDWKPEAGYTSLFNGKDLSGWKYYKETKLDGKTETSDKRFTVEKGAIKAYAKKGDPIKDLFTVEDFNKNFHLKLEFRAEPMADSGVYIRSSGAQLQVRDYVRRKERMLTKFKNDDWNELDITVEGGKSACVVNGKTLSAKDTLELTFKGGVPMAIFNGKSEPVNKIEVSTFAEAKCFCNGEFLETMKVPLAGGIGLQAEAPANFEFRRIRVKNLD